VRLGLIGLCGPSDLPVFCRPSFSSEERPG
jgi:hypothetical protein